MPTAHHARLRPRMPLRRLLTVLVAIGQLLAVSAAWLDRAPDPTGARAHVEAAGTRLHHGHSDSVCDLCSAQHVGGAPSPLAALAIAAGAEQGDPGSWEASPVQAERASANRTRAPPRRV